MTSKSIPLIDFSPFLLDEGVIVGLEPTEGQRQVAQAIDKICREHGFLCMTNFGMDSDLRDQFFAVSANLFGMEDKSKLVRIKPETNTGYAPVASESINRSRPPEMKEAYNVRFPPKRSNDLSGCPPSFGPLMEKILPVYKNLTHRYAKACALGLGVPVDFFADKLVDFDLCTVRLLHYPACDWDETSAANPGDVSKSIRIGEHTDFGAYTFLMVHPDHGPDGLQIKPVQGGEVGGVAGGEGEGWQDVVLPVVDKAIPVLIVNTGALMARVTNDEWNATAHRVIVKDASAAARSRYSVACFVDFDSDSIAEVHASFAKNGQPIKYSPIKSADYLAQKLQSMMKPK